MKRIAITTLILLSLYSCKKPQEGPALPVPKDISGYWRVTETATPYWTEDYRYDTFLLKRLKKMTLFFLQFKREIPIYIHGQGGPQIRFE